MDFILISALIFMIATSIVLIRNRIDFKSISSIDPISNHSDVKISICVPARNEEGVIERCVISLINQKYQILEVLVLDDHSDDSTPEILKKLKSEHNQLTIIQGKSKPDDWLGKPWACYQLSEKADGNLLIFVDADVWMEPDVIARVANRLMHFDALTIWPQQQVITFWEKLIVPTIYFSLLTLLPSIYVERSPRWMPKFLRPKLNQKFTAACGQFIAFRRTIYESFEGHASVKDKVVEDMEFSRILKRRSFNFLMMNGIEAVYCRMYASGSEIWSGFQKNFLAGFGSAFEFLFMAFLHLLFFLFPLYILFEGITQGNPFLVITSGSIIALFILQRLFLNIWFKWNWWISFFHPLAVFWFQILGIKCLANKLFGLKTTWKGRSV